MPSGSARLTQATALLLLAGTMLFAVTATTLQFTRHDLDPIAAPLSAYLTGPGGPWLRWVYGLMGIGLVALGLATWRLSPPMARSGLAAWLFAGAGLAMPVIAATELYAGTPLEALARLVHLLSAQATFLWLSFAMLLLSHRWRKQGSLRQGSLTGCLLAWLATTVLWVQVFARTWPHGLMQKLAIGLILLWLIWAARQLWRAAGSATED